MSAYASRAAGSCRPPDPDRRRTARFAASLCLIGALALAACTDGEYGAPTGRTTQGAAIGAVVGGLTGAVLDDKHRRGAALGAAAGAAIGGGIGYLLDRQQADLEEVLAEEETSHVAEVERIDGDLLKVTISNEVSFDSGSTSIRPSFLPTIERVAEVLDRYDNSRVLIIGHTDAGDEARNRQLSQARAEAVRDALATYGVDPERIRAEGRGDSEPRADNATPAGREANRRVEILITPVA